MNQETWSGSYSKVYKPDFSILLKVNNQDHWIHFDAKYRLNNSIWTNQNDDTSTSTLNDQIGYDGRSFNQDDLSKMHTYRDSILGSRGAFILYPADLSKAEVFHRYPGA
ncbi:hypothetical protein B1748_09155 [Paenibacillus sp. MY03]|nr:hypothetical protein B1748_09155 [Paenibacillus sp. MY03]